MNPLAFLNLSPGVGEILLILIAALLLFGADELPGVARSLGRFLHQIRHAADDFNDQLLDADRTPTGTSSSDARSSAPPKGTDAGEEKDAGVSETNSRHPSAARERSPFISENGDS